MCECKCHKSGAALCGSCCFHDDITEKNKHMSYLHPTDALFKRVDKLESMYQSDFEKTKEVIDVLEKQTQAILELEKWKEAAIEKNIQDVNWIKELEKRIKNWEEEFYFLKDKLRTTDKKPHKCPVCDGRGKIQLVLPAGGYWEQNCASCGMNGVVWG